MIMDLSNVFAIVILIAIVVFIMWLMIKRDRAKLPETAEMDLPEFSANVHKMSPSRKLKMLTDDVHRLGNRRLVPDQVKIDAVRDRVQELRTITKKAQLLYQNELLQCINAIAWLEESKSIHARCDPPGVHLACPFTADVARAAKLASQSVDLWRDSSESEDRLQRKASWVRQPSSLQPCLPVVDEWLCYAVCELTVWLDFVSKFVEEYAWLAVANATNYTWLAKEAVDLAHRFVYVTTRVNPETDQTTVTVDFMVPADVVKSGEPIVGVPMGRSWRPLGLCCVPMRYEKPSQPSTRPKRFNLLNIVTRGITGARIGV